MMTINSVKAISPQFPYLTSQVLKELSFATEAYGFNNPGNSNPDDYYEMQSWMIVMVHIYKCLADNYDPYRRRVLKLLFTALAN